MNKIIEINDLITKKQISEILNLVDKNANFINVNIFEMKSEIYEYMKTFEKVKVEMYLSRIGILEPRATHLIITTDTSNMIIGYILYHKVINKPNDIAIINTIVASKFRKQGVLKNMMKNLKINYNSISLSCFPKLVKLYEKLGFMVACRWETQIGMYYGHQENGGIITIDDEFIKSNEIVKKEFEKFKKNKDWKSIMNKLNSDNKKAIEFAKKYKSC